MNKLTDYKDLTAFNENTILTQLDGQVYVKKILGADAADIYKKLIGKRCRNVAEVVEIYEYEDRAIIIEEYINGVTLGKMLERCEKLDDAQVRSFTVQICDGLAFLHSLGIVHRDINPNNIMIDRDNTVKIIDFDISRFVRKNASADTAILGTVGYAAPEQFGFLQSDGRADVYAVGVLMNVMLTGNFPNVQTYGKKLGRIIKRATNMDVNMRYKSVKALKSAVTGLVAEDAPRLLKMLRSIPGFRTWKAWKMIIAVCFYFTYVPIIFLLLLNINSIAAAVKIVLSIICMFVIPFVMLTNLSGIQDKISKKRGIAITVSIIISLVNIVFGGIFLALR